MKKYLCFLQNIYVVCRKKCFDMEKKIFVEKNVNENAKKKKKISFQKYIFTQKMFVLQTKHKSFLNIYSLSKNKIFDHEKYIC